MDKSETEHLKSPGEKDDLIDREYASGYGKGNTLIQARSNQVAPAQDLHKSSLYPEEGDPFDKANLEKPQYDMLVENVQKQLESIDASLVQTQGVRLLSELITIEKAEDLDLLKYYDQELNNKWQMRVKEDIDENSFISQFMGSPCNKYTLFTALLTDTSKMPISVLYSNETCKRLKVFKNFGHLSFIPETSVIVGVTLEEEHASNKRNRTSGEKPRVQAYDIEKGAFIGGNNQSKIATSKSSEERGDQATDGAVSAGQQEYNNYFSCYVSEIMFDKAINVNPHQDIIGSVFGSTQVVNGEIGNWCGRMIFYYGKYKELPTKKKKYTWEENDVDPIDCEVRINPEVKSLPEFAERENLKIFLLCGCQQLVVYGLLSDKIKKGIVIYEVKMNPKRSGDFSFSRVDITDIKISKRVNFPDEVAFQKDQIQIEINPYDPMMTASTHVPNLLLSKNNNEYYVMDFRKRQPSIALKADEITVRRINSYGRNGQCLVGYKDSKNLKIWVKKQMTEDEDINPYVELFDLPIADINNVHLSADLRQLWVERRANDDDSRLDVYQVNLTNRPHIRTHKYLNEIKKEVKYLTDGTKELFVDNSKVIFIDKKNPSGKIVRNMKDVIGTEMLDKEIQSISATSDFKIFYFMLIGTDNAAQMNSNQIDSLGNQFQLYVFKVGEDMRPISKEGGQILKGEGLSSKPDKAFMCGQFAFFPQNPASASHYGFRNVEDMENKNFHSLPAIDMNSVKKLEYGLINNILFYYDSGTRQENDFSLKGVDSVGNSFSISSLAENVKNLFLRVSHLSNYFTSNAFGNCKRLVAFNKEAFAVLDLGEQKHFIRREKVNLMSKPELSPCGHYVYYVDDAYKVKMMPCATGEKTIEITTVERAVYYDLAYVIEPGVQECRKLAIIGASGSQLKVRVWCLDTSRDLYRFVASSPYQIDINVLQNHRMTKSCYFSRDCFELCYFNSETKKQIQLHYDLKPDSRFASNIMLPVLLRNYSFCENDEDKQNLIERIVAYINMIYPNIYGEIRVLFSLLYNLNEKKVFEAFLNNIQSDMLFYECNIFNIFFDYSKPNESRQSIYDSAEQEASTDTDNHVVNPDDAQAFMEKNHQKEMTNQLSRDLFKLLMLSKVQETIICELPDEMARSFALIQKKTDEEFNIWIELQKLKQKLQSKPAEYYTTYEVYRSLTKLDLTSGSKACTNLFLTMSKLSDEDIETATLPLIYYKWKYTFIFALPYSVLYWTMAVVAYVFLGFYPEVKELAYAVGALNILFLLYEIKTAFTLGFIEHYKDLWNWGDLFILGCCFTVVVLCLTLDYTSAGMITARLLAITAVWIRAITWLRAFGPTRYLITIVFQVFIDMIPFLIIFICAIVWYLFIWRLTPFLEEPLPLSTLEPDTFYKSLYVPVMLIFGNGPSGETLSDGSNSDFSYIRFFVNIIGNVVLSLCFLNFLIAIISGTFEKVNEKKELYDVKELLNMIIEFNAFMEGIVCVKPKPAYFITLQPKITAEEGLQQLEEKIVQMDEKIMKKFHKLEDNLTEKMYSKFEKMDDEIKALFKEMTVQVKEVQNQLKNQAEKQAKNKTE